MLDEFLVVWVGAGEETGNGADNWLIPRHHTRFNISYSLFIAPPLGFSLFTLPTSIRSLPPSLLPSTKTTKPILKKVKNPKSLHQSPGISHPALLFLPIAPHLSSRTIDLTTMRANNSRDTPHGATAWLFMASSSVATTFILLGIMMSARLPIRENDGGAQKGSAGICFFFVSFHSLLLCMG
jgi:hypothetical protein